MLLFSLFCRFRLLLFFVFFFFSIRLCECTSVDASPYRKLLYLWPLILVMLSVAVVSYISHFFYLLFMLFCAVHFRLFFFYFFRDENWVIIAYIQFVYYYILDVL